MELELSVPDVLKVDEEGFLCFSGRDYLKQPRPQKQQQGLNLLCNIINGLGERSAHSQKLKQIITTSIKFYNTDQRIYIKVAGNKALGFVKVGERKLFYHDYLGAIKELNPTAVLDIYVHESCQRTGIGKQIFEKFLRLEDKTPQKLAYDRPSEKLISFLKKHYNLTGFIPQNNNYVIFDRFFNKTDKPDKPKTTDSQNKQRNNTILQRVSLNTTQKVEPQDSLNKLTKEMQNMTFQQANSYKVTKDQTKSSFGCPWAVQEKVGFRTTSNTYGNYYQHPRRR